MIKDAVNAVIKAILSEKDYLSQLDSKIGDGDHGLNMARGAQAAEEAVDELDDSANIKEVLRTVGDAVLMNVGGTAGPLYGAGILEASRVVDRNSKLNAATLEKVFGAMVTAIQRRGHAEKGDKTMLDVLIPIYETFKAAKGSERTFEEILTSARDAAKNGVEFTKTIPARRGRASYFGDKSIGFEDPGAMSSLIMFRTLCGYWKNKD